MKALYALPLVLLSLFAVATPAGAEELRFADAEAQLLEVLEQFGFDEIELAEDSESCVRYRILQDGFIFHVCYYSDERFVCFATWENDRGERRDTLQQANDWNRSSWNSRVIIMSNGSWKLFTAAPREARVTLNNAVDLIEIFLDETNGFIETF